MRTTKQLLTLFLVFSLLFYFSCKKTDTISPNEKLSTNSSIEEKFFNSHRTTDATEKALIDYLKRINTTDKFVEKTAAKIGYPRWDKAITNAKKKGGLFEQNLLGDSIQTFYIPFVRDSQNFVNASMIIQTSQTDTSFTYRCDWQYAQIENNVNSAIDSAEHFAVFFMVLDKAVFGHNKFNIVDTNLFRTEHGPTKYVKLDSIVGSNANNFYNLVEFCEDVVVFVQYCRFPDSDQCKNGCDWCYQCVQSSHYTYCWEEYVWMGGGSPGGGTGGPGGGGGTGGGGSTPPDCGVVPIDPLVAGRVEPCDEEPGWEPEPIEVDPACDPHSIMVENICVNPNNFPGKELGFPYLWWQDNTWLLNNFRFGINSLVPNAPTEDLTMEELMLINYFPWAALKIRSNATLAQEETLTRFGRNGLNDKSDAFRHAYWLALNTKKVGGNLALLFSNAHESEVPSKFILEKQMDLHNNGVGISLCPQNSLTDAYLSQTAWQAVLNGQLKYLTPINYSDPCYWGCQGNNTGTHGITTSTQIKPTNQ